MEMPTPGPEHAQMARLAGTWEGEETLSPSLWSPHGGNTTARYRSHMALHDFFLLTDYEQERDGAITFRGHGIIGWDAPARRYVMYWFDSTGFLPGDPATGTWEGDTLTLAHKHERGHARYVWTVTGRELRMRIENSEDGREWVTFVDGVFQRTA
jgi:hypothetical protein